MKSKTIEAAADERRHLDRRTFLKVTSAGTALGVVGESLFGSLVYADTLGKEKRDKMTPDEILAQLKRGNKNFSKGLMTARNYRNEQKTTAKGQFPAAVILSCIDSRAPAEVIMDLGIGDIFQCPCGRQHRKRRHLGQHGICLQVGGCQGRLGDGTYRLWRDQGRHRQRRAGQPHRLAREDRTGGEGNHIQGRTIFEERRLR
jgi:hypothetical protein